MSRNRSVLEDWKTGKELCREAVTRGKEIKKTDGRMSGQNVLLTTALGDPSWNYLKENLSPNCLMAKSDLSFSRTSDTSWRRGAITKIQMRLEWTIDADVLIWSTECNLQARRTCVVRLEIPTLVKIPQKSHYKQNSCFLI